MKNILLTTTALVALAGAAVAEGHTSLKFTGKVTGGVAREGGAAAGTQSSSSKAAQKAAIADSNPITDAAEYQADVLAQVNTSLGGALTLSGVNADDLVALRAAIKTAVTVANESGSSGTALKATLKPLSKATAALNAAFGSVSSSTGDMATYAEFSGTVVGSVESNGLTISGAISIDAGTGYDFADDDGFDPAKTNGVSLDYIKVDGGAMGALTLNKDGIAHLVDGDDDESGDVKYTNDFGPASVDLVFDTAADTDETASKSSITWDETADKTVYTDAVAANVQWSVKVAAPVGEAATVYAAFDEEKGNAFGGTYAISGVTVSLDSKLEALDAATSADRSNTLGATFVSGAVTVGASFNTIKDGNQWSLNGAYAQDGMSFGFKTNEAEKWTATAGYELSDAASIEAGVNYTEDAYAGLSFKF